jgi:hypothetical protein
MNLLHKKVQKVNFRIQLLNIKAKKRLMSYEHNYHIIIVYKSNDIIKIDLNIMRRSFNLKESTMSKVVFLVEKNQKCLRDKDRLVLTPEQNNTVMAYANTVAKHTELDLKFILNEVYQSIRIFCEHHTLPCFASYNDVDVSIKLQIIQDIAEILFNRLTPFVNQKLLDYALTQALYTISSLYMTN